LIQNTSLIGAVCARIPLAAIFADIFRPYDVTAGFLLTYQGLITISLGRFLFSFQL